MKFPLLNISEEKWIIDDLLEYIDFNGYFYSADQNLFEKYAYQKLHCDSEGSVYKVVGKTPPKGWRNYLRFIPNVYREKLIYEATNEKMGLDDLRKYVLMKVDKLEDNEFKSEWISNVKQAESYQELITAI